MRKFFNCLSVLLNVPRKYVQITQALGVVFAMIRLISDLVSLIIATYPIWLRPWITTGSTAVNFLGMELMIAGLSTSPTESKTSATRSNGEVTVVGVCVLAIYFALTVSFCWEAKKIYYVDSLIYSRCHELLISTLVWSFSTSQIIKIKSTRRSLLDAVPIESNHFPPTLDNRMNNDNVTGHN